MLKLPRLLESDPTISEKWGSFFQTQPMIRLWAGGTLKLPSLAFSSELRQALGFARRCGSLKGGLELIAQLLQNEAKGLSRVAEEGAQSARRISRLLLVSQDGSERFYRQCEGILTKHQDRIWGAQLQVDAQELGRTFFGGQRGVRAVLVLHKEAVGRVLKSLLEPV